MLLFFLHPLLSPSLSCLLDSSRFQRLLGNWDGFSSRWPGVRGLLAGCGERIGFLLAVRRGRGNGGTTARSKAWLVFVLSSKFRCHDGIRKCEWSGATAFFLDFLLLAHWWSSPHSSFFLFFLFFGMHNFNGMEPNWLMILKSIKIGDRYDPCLSLTSQCTFFVTFCR